MKIIYNNIIPFKGYMAINLFGLLFVRKEYKDRIDKRVINHESIHTEQMKETLWIPYYIWYIIEYLLIELIYLFKKKDTQNDRYHEVSFEEEAHNNENNLDYLKSRKRYSWLKYLKFNSYNGQN